MPQNLQFMRFMHGLGKKLRDEMEKQVFTVKRTTNMPADLWSMLQCHVGAYVRPHTGNYDRGHAGMRRKTIRWCPLLLQKFASNAQER